MVLTYPMELFVCRKILSQFLFSASGGGLQEEELVLSTRQHAGCTVGLWAVTLAIALVFTDLGLVLSLMGTVCGSWLGFIIPASVHFALHPVRASLDKLRGAGGVCARLKGVMLDVVWPGVIGAVVRMCMCVCGGERESMFTRYWLSIHMRMP
jgi:hypothetical protein